MLILQGQLQHETRRMRVLELQKVPPHLLVPTPTQEQEAGAMLLLILPGTIKQNGNPKTQKEFHSRLEHKKGVRT